MRHISKMQAIINSLNLRTCSSFLLIGKRHMRILNPPLFNVINYQFVWGFYQLFGSLLPIAVIRIKMQSRSFTFFGEQVVWLFLIWNFGKKSVQLAIFLRALQICDYFRLWYSRAKSIKKSINYELCW